MLNNVPLKIKKRTWKLRNKLFKFFTWQKLILETVFNLFTMSAGVKIVCQSKVFANEKIHPPATANNSRSPRLRWHVK